MKELIVKKNEASSTDDSSYDTSYESSYDYSTSIPYDNSTETGFDETESDYTETDNTETDDTETDNTETKKITLKKGKGNMMSVYKSVHTLKRDITTPTVKNKLSNKEILKKLEGCISLNTIEEMDVLKTLPIMRSWIRYMNKNTKLFKLGGLLMKVNYPTYIVLANPVQKIVWSVQLNDNIIFIKDTSEIDKNNKIKEKLFKLYTDGRLLLKDD
jgi:hypothetical protein